MLVQAGSLPGEDGKMETSGYTSIFPMRHDPMPTLHRTSWAMKAGKAISDLQEDSSSHGNKKLQMISLGGLAKLHTSPMALNVWSNGYLGNSQLPSTARMLCLEATAVRRKKRENCNAIIEHRAMAGLLKA